MNGAIAVLVGAVDVDIASEQVAAEAKLEALIKRGKLTDAYRADRVLRMPCSRRTNSNSSSPITTGSDEG